MHPHLDNAAHAVTDSSPSPLANFWARLFAFLVDLLLFALANLLVLRLCAGALLALGEYSRLVGVGGVLLYFGVLQSRTGGGHTPGQRLCHLLVVDQEGRGISPGRSCARALILWSPLLLGQLLSVLLPTTTALSWAPTVVALALAAGLCYFYLGNGHTRQSLHDIVCGTYVIRDSHFGLVYPHLQPVARRHYLICLLLMVAVCCGDMWVISYRLNTPLLSLQSLIKSYQHMNGGRVISIETEGPAGQSLQITVIPAGRRPDPQMILNAARETVDNYTLIGKLNTITIHSQRRAHVMCCMLTDEYFYTETPQHWRTATRPPEPRQGTGFWYGLYF